MKEMKTHKDVLSKALKDRKVKREYDALESEFKTRRLAIKAKHNGRRNE